MSSGRLLGICGSLRAGSLNRKLLMEAKAAFDPATFDDADLRFPLYDGDLESRDGIPEAVQTLSDQIAQADAVVIASPEYNKSISGALKNALDWVSRTEGNPWGDKPLAIMSATAGRAGGERGQLMMRESLVAFRPRLVTGPEVLVGAAQDQFEGEVLTNEINRKALNGLMDALRTAAGL
ncbi:NADPH-dependent FMN reductase [Gymnodinialimonas ulvae]|uniref:NADPH-dependent FMN reductase n=1 Tax=Gymnodinialimonas ulvae TaxID=3126504 RepID=UPI0030ADDF94